MKIPGTDAAKNLYHSFNLGFNPRAAKIPLYGAGKGLSFSGLMTAGGLVGAGAALGAAAGSQMEGDMVGKGAAVGALAGAAALPVAGLAANVGLKVGTAAMKGVGSAVFATPKIAAGTVKGGIGFARGISQGIGPLKTVSGMAGGAFSGFASMMVDWDNTKKGRELLESVKLTNPISGAKAGFKSLGTYKDTVKGFKSASLAGKAKIGAKTVGLTAGKGIQGVTGALINGQTILWGSSLLVGAAGAFNEMNRIHMGQMDGQITRPTPRVPSYFDNAGATGDLVFALNANRRG